MQQSWLARLSSPQSVSAEAFLSTELRELDPTSVNFSNWVELIGLRLIQDAAGIALRLRWKALRRPQRPLRCFVHLLAQGRQISSLDHDLLRGRPPTTCWDPGDEGYELLRHWLPAPPELKLRLGVYDPLLNVRFPVLASTLPVTDAASAVWAEPVSAEIFHFEQRALAPCRVEFEDGLELTAYSAVRHNELLWLRLKWTVRQGSGRRVRFFGHVVDEPAAEAPSVAQFDQDLARQRRGPATVEEQNIVRALGAAQPGWLRLGVFRPSSQKRLRIHSSVSPLDERFRCTYLKLNCEESGE